MEDAFSMIKSCLEASSTEYEGGRQQRDWAWSLAVPAAGAMADLALAGLAPGLYHLRVQAGGWQISRTLVVE